MRGNDKNHTVIAAKAAIHSHGKRLKTLESRMRGNDEITGFIRFCNKVSTYDNAVFDNEVFQPALLNRLKK